MAAPISFAAVLGEYNGGRAALRLLDCGGARRLLVLCPEHLAGRDTAGSCAELQEIGFDGPTTLEVAGVDNVKKSVERLRQWSQ